MKDTFDHMDDLIGKYLTGEATSREVQEVERWAKASQVNQKHLDQLNTIFERSSSMQENLHFDEDQAWRNMKLKMDNKKDRVMFLGTPRRAFFYRVAASIVILFSVGFYFYKSSVQHAHIEVIADNKGIGNTLPDGSDIFLNKDTKLTYHYDDKKKTRVVKLKGEAFFHIKHEEKKQFLIEAAGTYIRDIGTIFSVKAYPKSNTIEVVVKEGEVEFFADGIAGIHLVGSSKGIFNKLTRKFTTEMPDSNAFSFKTKFFTFANQNLSDVIEDVNGVYDKKIIISNNLRHCYITVTFDNEDIDEIADVIAETLGLTVKRSGNEIRLEGSGCE